MVGKIAGELRGLREELRHQMTAGLQREFDALRKDIDRAFKSTPPGARQGQRRTRRRIRTAFRRHPVAVREERRQKHQHAAAELEQIKRALDTLAREESVQSVDRRWDDFDRRWSAFEDRVDADAAQALPTTPALAALTERLEQISNAVNNLPESLSLRSLEEKVRTLAGAVEHFASQAGRSRR